jgi:hypothetical protein
MWHGTLIEFSRGCLKDVSFCIKQLDEDEAEK